MSNNDFDFVKSTKCRFKRGKTGYLKLLNLDSRNNDYERLTLVYVLYVKLLNEFGIRSIAVKPNYLSCRTVLCSCGSLKNAIFKILGLM